MSNHSKLCNKRDAAIGYELLLVLSTRSVRTTEELGQLTGLSGESLALAWDVLTVARRDIDELLQMVSQGKGSEA